MLGQHLWYLGDLIPFIPSWIDESGETSFKPPSKTRASFMVKYCLLARFFCFLSFLSFCLSFFLFYLPNLYSWQREEIVLSVHCSLGSNTGVSLCTSEIIALLFGSTLGKMKGNFFLVLLNVDTCTRLIQALCVTSAGVRVKQGGRCIIQALW